MHVVLKHMKACRGTTGSYCCSQYVSGVVIATSGRKNAAGCDVARHASNMLE